MDGEVLDSKPRNGLSAQRDPKEFLDRVEQSRDGKPEGNHRELLEDSMAPKECPCKAQIHREACHSNTILSGGGCDQRSMF